MKPHLVLVHSAPVEAMPALRLPGEGHPARATDARFWAIFVVSILLHGGLLVLGAFLPRHDPVLLPPLQATLRAVVTPVAPVATTATESGQAAAPSRPAAVPPQARPEVQRQERPAPRQPTAGPANAPAPMTAATATPSATAAAGPSAPAAPSPAVSAAAPSTDAAASAPAPAQPASRPAVDALGDYRRQLTELFARTHDYPRIAALRGWEGEVRLRLKVARKGTLLGVAIDRSSGFDVLDRDALALLEGQGSLPPLPEAVEGNEIQVVVPISYKLRKTT